MGRGLSISGIGRRGPRDPLIYGVLGLGIVVM